MEKLKMDLGISEQIDDEATLLPPPPTRSRDLATISSSEQHDRLDEPLRLARDDGAADLEDMRQLLEKVRLRLQEARLQLAEERRLFEAERAQVEIAAKTQLDEHKRRSEEGRQRKSRVPVGQVVAKVRRMGDNEVKNPTSLFGEDVMALSEPRSASVSVSLEKRPLSQRPSPQPQLLRSGPSKGSDAVSWRPSLLEETWEGFQAALQQAFKTPSISAEGEGDAMVATSVTQRGALQENEQQGLAAYQDLRWCAQTSPSKHVDKLSEPTGESVEVIPADCSQVSNLVPVHEAEQTSITNRSHAHIRSFLLQHDQVDEQRLQGTKILPQQDQKRVMSASPRVKVSISPVTPSYEARSISSSNNTGTKLSAQATSFRLSPAQHSPQPFIMEFGITPTEQIQFQFQPMLHDISPIPAIGFTRFDGLGQDVFQPQPMDYSAARVLEPVPTVYMEQAWNVPHTEIHHSEDMNYYYYYSPQVYGSFLEHSKRKENHGHLVFKPVVNLPAMPVIKSDVKDDARLPLASPLPKFSLFPKKQTDTHGPRSVEPESSLSQSGLNDKVEAMRNIEHKVESAANHECGVELGDATSKNLDSTSPDRDNSLAITKSDGVTRSESSTCLFDGSPVHENFGSSRPPKIEIMNKHENHDLHESTRRIRPASATSTARSSDDLVTGSSNLNSYLPGNDAATRSDAYSVADLDNLWQPLQPARLWHQRQASPIDLSPTGRSLLLVREDTLAQDPDFEQALQDGASTKPSQQVLQAEFIGSDHPGNTARQEAMLTLNATRGQKTSAMNVRNIMLGAAKIERLKALSEKWRAMPRFHEEIGRTSTPEDTEKTLLELLRKAKADAYAAAAKVYGRAARLFCETDAQGDLEEVEYEYEELMKELRSIYREGLPTAMVKEFLWWQTDPSLGYPKIANLFLFNSV